MTHLDLRAATAKQVQQLRFVEFEVWFLPRRDERALEGFYTPLQEDFYNAYLNSGAVFRSQTVCHIDSSRIKGELHPYMGAPTRTSGEWRLSDTSVKHRRVLSSLFTLSIYFEHLLCAIHLVFIFIELPC